MALTWDDASILITKTHRCEIQRVELIVRRRWHCCVYRESHIQNRKILIKSLTRAKKQSRQDEQLPFITTAVFWLLLRAKSARSKHSTPNLYLLRTDRLSSDSAGGSYRRLFGTLYPGPCLLGILRILLELRWIRENNDLGLNFCFR